MHPIDRAASWLFRFGPASLRVFSEGWGDERLIANLDTASEVEKTPELDVEWSDAATDDGVTIRDGSFVSPAADLPRPSRLAHVRLLLPPIPNGRLVVMMAAWNDHGYASRTGLARGLLDHGITAVLLENPFYGSRRPRPDQPIRTVADFAVMGRAAVLEGRALLKHFAASHIVGVTGYSMGGNIAALVGALADEPVAIAGLAASHSPGPVWLDGVIRHAVDWDALGGTAVAPRLRATLGMATVLALEARPHTAAAVLVGGLGDGYIPHRAVTDLHDHWPGSQLRWIKAGHASMIWRHKPALVEAIVASFDRLERV